MLLLLRRNSASPARSKNRRTAAASREAHKSAKIDRSVRLGSAAAAAVCSTTAALSGVTILGTTTNNTNATGAGAGAIYGINSSSRCNNSIVSAATRSLKRCTATVEEVADRRMNGRATGSTTITSAAAGATR